MVGAGLTKARSGGAAGGWGGTPWASRAMAAALRRAGHTVTHREVPDRHNYTAWRDSLHPDLTTVLRDTWV